MLVCLVILVTLCRTFLAGSYIIETGSMAPCLLGYHRQAVCPGCRCSFAVEGGNLSIKAICPNCGKTGIAVENLTRNDGDHLLVYRGQFEFRTPRRWEVVVFRNPNKPTQAYVKRMIALPGESVQIVEGDIHISGQIQAKGYRTQLGIRIPVYDDAYRPRADDPHWKPRWVVEEPDGGWSESGGTFRFAPVTGESGADFSWVKYRHWVRQGGSHITRVPLDHWPQAVELPPTGIGPLKYDAETRDLVCRGALSLEIRNRLLDGSRNPNFRQAVERLYETSHAAPISDSYGYNRGQDGLGQHEIRDLMLSATVLLHDDPGEFVLGITDGNEDFECRFDAAAAKVRLIDTRTGRAMRTAPLNEELLREPTSVELSLMDHQVLLAVGGKLAFRPWSYVTAAEPGPAPRQPVRFGARGLAAEVGSLKLFRDVYYTDDAGRRAADAPVQLNSNEYFVLGDNSPVSKDSRGWSANTTLTDEMFLGKPVLVQYPSRNRRIQVGRWQTEIRIPEFSKIRYIH
jgi:signal peptidase I